MSEVTRVAATSGGNSGRVLPPAAEAGMARSGMAMISFARAVRQGCATSFGQFPCAAVLKRGTSFSQTARTLVS